jgi:hypothetical protein
LGGMPPVGRRRSGAPLGPRAVEGRLFVDEPGETRESDDERGFRPGLKGNGPGTSPLRGAGEYESCRGGGVPEGVEYEESLSRPHIFSETAVHSRAHNSDCSSKVRIAVAVAVAA